MLQKILVAHDFSEAASRALQYAADLAVRLGVARELHVDLLCVGAS